MAQTTDSTKFLIDNSLISQSVARLGDFAKQVNAIGKALEAATNGLVKVSTVVDSLTGKGTGSFTVPTAYANIARSVIAAETEKVKGKYGYSPEFLPTLREEQVRNLTTTKIIYGKSAQKDARDIAKALGADTWEQGKNKVGFSFPVAELDYQKKLAQYSGDESKAKQFFVKQFSKNFSSVMEKSDTALTESFIKADILDKIRGGRKPETVKKILGGTTETAKSQEKAATSLHRTALLARITPILAVLTIVADITRRILTATLARATEERARAAEANKVGISQENARRYGYQETAMGLPKGTITSALSELQKALGSAKKLNESTLSELATVLGGDVAEAINIALGKNKPEEVMKLILDRYFKQGMRGINSVGMQVGQEEAQRELATALENAGLGNLAEVLRNMFFVNKQGIYAGQLTGAESAFANYMQLVTAYTAGLTPNDYKHISELGQVVDSLDAKFQTLGKNLTGNVLISLEKVLNAVNEWNIGKSNAEILVDTKRSIETGNQAVIAMRGKQAVAEAFISSQLAAAGIDVSKLPGGSVSGLFTSIEQGKFKPKAGEELKLAQLLSTPQGDIVLSSMAYLEALKQKETSAQKDVEKSREKGKAYFSPSEYTPAAIVSLSSSLFSYKKGIVRNLIDAASGGGDTVDLINAEAVYQKLIGTLYGGKDLTWAQIKDNKNAEVLREKLRDRYGKENLASLSPAQIKDVILENLLNTTMLGQMGFSAETVETAVSAITEDKVLSAEAQAFNLEDLSNAIISKAISKGMINPDIQGVRALDYQTGRMEIVVKQSTPAGVTETVLETTLSELLKAKQSTIDVDATTENVVNRAATIAGTR